jgi:ketosteroid isomerase-like protein
MSQDPQKNMEVLRHLFNTLNGKDIVKFMKECEEVIKEDYALHDPGSPDQKPGRAQFLEDFKQNSKVRTNRRMTVEDMFGAGDNVVTRAT